MPAFLGLGPDNPVTWCNFYRKGGVRTLLGTSGAYFGILGALIFLSVRLNPRDAGRTYGTWVGVLTGLQFIFMVVIGAGRVSNTIRGDLSSGMAESLRMMPLPGRHAVVGYLSATAASLGGFFVANLVLGLFANTLADLPPGRWLAVNAIMFAFALFVWTIAAFMAFLVKGAGAVLVIVSMVGLFGNVGVLYVAPGLMVLAGPLIGGSAFSPRTAQTELAAPLIISLAAQFLLGALFFAGAARKYRRPDALALGGWLGLALLLAFVGISLLAIVAPEWFRPGFLEREFGRLDAAVPFCGSTILAMLVALVPLANFARLHVAWVRGRVDDPERRRAAPTLWVSGVLVTTVLALMLLAFPSPPEPRRAAFVLAAVWGFAMSAVFVAAWVYRAVENAKVILSIWLVVQCLVPLAVDFARERMSDGGRDEPMLATAGSFSPIGLLIEAATAEDPNRMRAWDEPRPREPELWLGAGFNGVIPLLPIGLYVRAGRRKRAAAVATVA